MKKAPPVGAIGLLAAIAGAGAWWWQSQQALLASCTDTVAKSGSARQLGNYPAAQAALDGADARCAIGSVGNAYRVEQAEVLLAKAEVPAAAKAFEAESKVQPKNGRVWSQLGFALALLERRDEAALALEEALRNGDSTAGTVQRLVQLRQLTGTSDRLRALESALPTPAQEALRMATSAADSGR